MASEFQDCLEKLEFKEKDIEEVILNELLSVYTYPNPFIHDLKWGGFDITDLNQNQSLKVIISEFLTQCNGLSLDKLYEIFSKLHNKHQGLKSLKELKERLEKTKYPRVQWMLELSCHFDEIDDQKLNAIIYHLQQISGDISLTLKKKERGSIKLTFEGSQERMEKIKALFESGELTAILEIPIKNISLVKEEPALLSGAKRDRVRRTPIPTRKILILSANPKGTSQLRVDEEMREIKEGLRRSKQREDFVIETIPALRYRDIRRAILDYEPNIVHFSGHGAGEEGLAFEDETGQEKLVGAEPLAKLFKLFADKIECVVLNACYSEVQAKAIAQHIDSVVGMNKAIGDRAAIEFAIGFYDALGAGRTVEFAYELGCNSIEMAGIPENLIPQLLGKNHPGVSPFTPKIRLPSPPLIIETPETPSPPPSGSPVREDPISRIDPKIYEELEKYLANQQWKEADLETMRLMIEIADSMESSNQFSEDRDVITWLDQQDIDKIPDEALKTIDKLWVKYSQGHFGFSVQAKIWRECGGKQDEFDFIISPNKFAKNLGWYDGRNWIKRYDQFDFSIEAKRGHLPSLSFPNKKNQFLDLITWTKTFKHLIPRLFSCGLTL